MTQATFENQIKLFRLSVKNKPGFAALAASNNSMASQTNNHRLAWHINIEATYQYD